MQEKPSKVIKADHQDRVKCPITEKKFAAYAEP